MEIKSEAEEINLYLATLESIIVHSEYFFFKNKKKTSGKI